MPLFFIADDCITVMMSFCCTHALFYLLDPRARPPTMLKAWKLDSQTVFAAGLFNGPQGEMSENDGNGRARIPPYQVKVAPMPDEAEDASGRALDVMRAVFIARRTVRGGLVSIEDRYYAPLQSPELLVHEIAVVNRGSAPFTLQLSSGAAPPECDAKCRLLASSAQKAQERQSNTLGGDLNLHRVSGSDVPANVYAVAGTNKVPETEAFGYTEVALAANIPASSSVTVSGHGGEHTVYAIQAIVTSLNSTNVTAAALAALARGQAGALQLLSDHVAAWSDRNAVGGLEVEGDLQLAQALNASLYFIRSSIRSDYAHGLSPGGLASDGYGGHTFWDQETWMWPPLLMLDPECAKSALQYRFDRLDGAHNRSIACNPDPSPSATYPFGTPYCGENYVAPKDGLIFPWESACTGNDVQTTHGVCGPWCQLEQHVSGDIVFAVRQYWYATGDLQWLQDIGWPIVKGVANFYAARVIKHPTQAKQAGAGHSRAGDGGSADVYDYNHVMGPDEFQWPVNNSVYTNNVVKVTLSFATEAAKVLNVDAPPEWKAIEDGIVILWNETVPGHPEMTGGYHPEHAGFAGQSVKQADTVMLAYPFMADMPTPVLENDLAYYTDITVPNGPAMTWAVFAIDWMVAALQNGTKSFGNYSRAEYYFRKGYANVLLPFNVWRETPGGGT